jgi:hypothetical protein
MDWWRALRIAFFITILGISIFVPAAWPVSIVRALAYLGASGLAVEQQIIWEERRFEQEMLLKEKDEKANESQHKRDMEFLRELEKLIEMSQPADQV